jgi:hypothetical protein
LRIRLLALTTLLSAVPLAGTCSDTTTLRCDLGGRAFGQTVSLIVTLTVRAGGVMIHAATATAQPARFQAANDRMEATVEVAPDGGGCTIPGTGAMTCSPEQREPTSSAGSAATTRWPEAADPCCSAARATTASPAVRAPTPLWGGDGSDRILGGTVTT